MSGSSSVLGPNLPKMPVLLDTDVFINSLAGRGPRVLRDLLDAVYRVFVAAPTRAELAWVSGRLDPVHPGTGAVLSLYAQLMARIDPAKVLVPADQDWMEAGKLAGAAARAIAGGARKTGTAFDRVELISDALIAVLAHKAGLTIVTADKDFQVLGRLMPGLSVLFYEQVGLHAKR